MRISKLRLSGFKSFVEPCELRIEPGLTGIVGPNGCGKSNLLEAIRWVMGENSPKSMRGAGMEDVIFAGTAQRPPRDFAEVVLQAEDDNREELEVTRRIERGAGSAYRVNGRDVRAKDVALVFADAATGAHSPALVSQGKIAAVIAAKPAERRQMLEEAAGIAGLHVRRRDAESKLRQTESNLSRLDDLMAGLDAQMASLRRQARQAERYKALSDKIHVAEAQLLFSRWRDAAAAAEAAKAEAKAAGEAVEAAQQATETAQREQAEATATLTIAREKVADRRDDASAHGHRMAALATQLEAAEQRLADLDRQQRGLEEDREEADRLTRDAAEALKKLEVSLAENERRLADDEESRPVLARRVADAESASRNAELALAKATAEHAGVEAEWRVAEAELSQAEARLARLEREVRRQDEAFAALAQEGDPGEILAQAAAAAETAGAELAERRARLESLQSRKEDLAQRREESASALSAAKAELAGTEREHGALQRDREAQAKQAAGKHGLPAALDRITAAPGYERALAAVLGRDARSPIGTPEDGTDGRFWTGSDVPSPVADNLAGHIPQCPPELAARLALVHVAETDDGRTLAPGEWLVTKAGALRRWDGLVACGEGAGNAARLEAQNRLAELAAILPGLRETAAEAEAAHGAAQTELTELQRELVEAERETLQAVERERTALRAMDQAESKRDRIANRRSELEAARADLAEQIEQARSECTAARDKREALPDPQSGRQLVEVARSNHEAARETLQKASATLAAHDQALAVARERTSSQRSDIKSWEARASDAAKRLSDMSRRAEEIAEQRAAVGDKPNALMREIEQGEAVRERLAAELLQAETEAETASAAATAANARQSELLETLATARETRAAAAARAENEEARRSEMARICGERFQCPPPLLEQRFGFAAETVRGPEEEARELERLTADRERIGPVNLVAASELEELEQTHGANAAEQAELAEAVNRLRGSIGNLNREGRERLRAAFTEVDGHFRRLFTRLFQGGQAHLALIDSDDPLEAGLEIFAQPPGKRLQSLSLLSGGEQALTAIALIFALFLTNPAPICVLDEVDAPLDDANIDRFCDLLDAMHTETDTRYLIVTHNAVTMSRMHRLFGVTMIEKGISRLVSVDLAQTEELLAAE